MLDTNILLLYNSITLRKVSYHQFTIQKEDTEMVITTDGNEVELSPEAFVYSQKDNVFKDWYELSPDVQERLEQIREGIEALTMEARDLVQ